MSEVKITKEDFREYEGCRQRGNTNMLHNIIKNYNKLHKNYMEGKGKEDERT